MKNSSPIPDYLARQSAYESNARTYPRRLPLVIDRGEGAYLTDISGKRYLDCLSNAGALPLGHNHAVTTEAIREHLDRGFPLQTLDLASAVKDQFVAELFDSLPSEFSARARIQFCGPGGADAVEAALKLTKTATGQRSVIAFHGAYHGQSHGALSLTGNLGPKSAIPGLMPDIHFMPFPYMYRTPFPGAEWQPFADYLQAVLDDPESGIPQPAALVLEIVQGEGGVVPAPEGWLREIRRLTRKHDIPLVIDEVQTGVGRTGTLYAFQRAGICPDVLVLSKAIGGGLPLSVVLYNERLDRWKPGAHAGTFRGNLLAMSTGTATLRYVRECGLAEHAERCGAELLGALKALQATHPFLGDVRGQGLMIGIEVVDPDRTDSFGRPRWDGDRAHRLQQACFDRRLILEVGGRMGSVLRLLPPLIIGSAEVDLILSILSEACDEIAQGTQANPRQRLRA
jgi:diaminobutyrate-2-oxoglutarate transaminase